VETEQPLAHKVCDAASLICEMQSTKQFAEVSSKLIGGTVGLERELIDRHRGRVQHLTQIDQHRTSIMTFAMVPTPLSTGARPALLRPAFRAAMPGRLATRVTRSGACHVAAR